MASPRRVLILYAHPAPQKSRVNRAMAAAVRGLPSVTFHDLYERYPDFDIDVKREQRLLLEHDLVVLQHPFYWYSVPSLIKEWCDLVLEYGFAYGQGTHQLAGKPWIHAITAGNPETSYHAEGYNRFTVRQLLAPLDQTAALCRMPFLAPFTVYGTLRLDERDEIPRVAQDYRGMIQWLQDTTLAWDELMAPEKINPLVSRFARKGSH